MSLTIAAKIQALDAINPTVMSVHSGDPGVSGNDNIIGEAKPCSYGAATEVGGNARRSLTAPVEFPIPAGTTVTHTVVKNPSATVLELHALAVPETYSNPNGVHVVATSNITLS